MSVLTLNDPSLSPSPSQVASALSAMVILVIMLWIGALFEELPKVPFYCLFITEVVLCVIVIASYLSVHQEVLAAIIYVNLHGMMKQFMDIPTLWKSNKVDMVSE